MLSSLPRLCPSGASASCFWRAILASPPGPPLGASGLWYVQSQPVSHIGAALPPPDWRVGLLAGVTTVSV
jgi:hypothetical protein